MSMFPGRPRRPMPPYPQARARQAIHGRNPSPKSNVMAMFRNPEGKLDFSKITETAQQMNDIYGQIKPLIATFKRK